MFFTNFLNKSWWMILWFCTFRWKLNYSDCAFIKADLICKKIGLAKRILVPQKSFLVHYQIINFTIALLDSILERFVQLSLSFFFASFLLSSLCSLYSYHSSNYRISNSCSSFPFLKTISISFSLLFAIAFKSEKEWQLIISQ